MWVGVLLEEIVCRQALGVQVDVNPLAARVPVGQLQGPRQAGQQHEADGAEMPGDSTKRAHASSRVYAHGLPPFNPRHVASTVRSCGADRISRDC
jgi:hypothetical protein